MIVIVEYVLGIVGIGMILYILYQSIIGFLKVWGFYD